MAENGVLVLTLEQAIKDKYCCQEDQPFLPASSKKAFNESSLGLRPGSCPVEQLATIVLDSKGVCAVGDDEDLSKLCPRVQELHLSSNCITHSSDVIKILRSMPCLRLFNLGHNPLASSTFQHNGHFSSHLTTLVLNGTSIGWGALENCLQGIQQLEELYLSLNNYTTVCLPETFLHSNLKQLHLNENKIKDWTEFVKLSQAFPSLQTLIACNNPIQDIPELTPDTFPSLLALNFNGSSLSSWESIEHLNTLSLLKELSLMKVPLGSELEENVRRQAFIARLPRVSKLNKSVVTETEREAAERWLIREMVGSLHRPAVYDALVEKHGELNALPDVDLNPVKTVRLKIRFKGVEREWPVNVDQTVWQFKTWIASKFLSVPPSGFRLWHHGNRPFTHNQKYLYSYRFYDGDRIHVEMK